MNPWHIIVPGRYMVFTLCVVATLGLVIAFWWTGGHSLALLILLATFAALAALGVHDLVQTRHAILRNYPVVGHMRFLLESIRPEMRQYFFETEQDGSPFPRNIRAVVYQRAKHELDKRSFGTQRDVYEPSFEWLHHSLSPRPVAKELPRIRIGGPDCTQPYLASLLNISAMSYGALSANAIRSLNEGARRGGFAHDTGEGGVSPYHREYGGDLIWEIGSGYFGCRRDDGSFCPDRFVERAVDPQIKMIEIKLSQGAKPGHGGVLPAAKVTDEIASIRGVAAGVDCVSPASHSAFRTPLELVRFVAELRRLSGGKPTGFKLCIGHPWEFLAIVKAMLDTNITPDFIVIDGKEGGTGAAPLEFMDHLGMPLRDGLSFAHNALVGANLRDRVRLGASAKIATAFDMVRVIALGADWCNSARAFMFAVGCIQAQQCHTDACPTGVATQNPRRQRAIVPTDKATRVANYHRETLCALAELVAAGGLDHPTELRPHHLMRRNASGQVETFAELYPMLAPGELLTGGGGPHFADNWTLARSDTFKRAEKDIAYAAE